MDSIAPKRTMGLIVVAALALVQSAAGVLRALRWFDIGVDLMGQGLLLLPVIGLVAIGRGALLALLALLLWVFACGALLRRSWARWLGIVLAIANLLLVASVVAQGEAPARAVVWSVVPVAMLGYLFSSSGRQALTADSNGR